MQFAQCCEEHRCRPKCDQVSRGEQGESGRGRGEKWEGYGFDLYALVRSRVGEETNIDETEVVDSFYISFWL